MKDPLVLLDAKKIKSLLTNKSIDLIVVEKIDSTNNYLRKIIAQHKKPSVCIAELQTKGKGRLGRQWHSPFGQNIYLSILYSFQKDTSELSGLSLVVALAACKAIEESCNLKQSLSIKWPNDIVADGKKIAGSLIEIQAESHGYCHVVIGLGINVNMQQASKSEINQSWASVEQLSEQYQDRNSLCAHLIDTLGNYLELFNQSGLNPFMMEWKKRDWLVNKTIRLISNKHEFDGICIGIDEHGHLLLTMKDKDTRTFASGDTTILKSHDVL